MRGLAGWQWICVIVVVCSVLGIIGSVLLCKDSHPKSYEALLCRSYGLSIVGIPSASA